MKEEEKKGRRRQKQTADPQYQVPVKSGQVKKTTRLDDEHSGLTRLAGKTASVQILGMVTGPWVCLVFQLQPDDIPYARGGMRGVGWLARWRATRLINHSCICHSRRRRGSPRHISTNRAGLEDPTRANQPPTRPTYTHYLCERSRAGCAIYPSHGKPSTYS